MRPLLLFIAILLVGIVSIVVLQRDRVLKRSTPEVEKADHAASADMQDVASEPDLPVVDDGPILKFDIVRVTRDGAAVIAGRADAQASVTLYANGTPLANEVAGPDGSWTIITQTPLQEGPVELSLSMRTMDGELVTSDAVVIVYVPERVGDKPLVMRTMPGTGSVVLQHPTDPDTVFGPLALETIDYDATGNVILSGRAETNATVEIFANKAFTGKTQADENGRWSISTPIRPGRYTLQIVQLNAFGHPAFAIEVPFERATYHDVKFVDGNVIVQPGNSLWVISRQVLGEGAHYTVIYAANAAQIRDPDLIYPGQIFQIPDQEGTPSGASEEESDT